MKKGNTLGSDIRKGKQTLLMINALKNADQKEKEILNKICGKSDATKEEILEVVAIFDSTGSIKRAQELAGKYIKKGKECLENLRGELTEEGHKFFLDLANYMVDRTV